MFDADALLLARIASGDPGESSAHYDLSLISPELLPLAAQLIVASPVERREIWDEFLARAVDRAPILATTPETEPEPAMPMPFSSRWICHSAQFPAPTPVTQSPPPARSEHGVRMTRALDVQPREIDWLWTDRVPLGMMTMFAGDPKLGKSFVTLAMAAALSRGLPLPLSDRPNRPQSTILMSAEDDPARTVVPRLIAAGADLAKVHILESVVRANGDEALPTLAPTSRPSPPPPPGWGTAG